MSNSKSLKKFKHLHGFIPATLKFYAFRARNLLHIFLSIFALMLHERVIKSAIMLIGMFVHESIIKSQREAAHKMRVKCIKHDCDVHKKMLKH